MFKYVKFLKNLILYKLGKIKPIKTVTVPLEAFDRQAVSKAKEEYLKQFPENPVKVRTGQSITLATESNEYDTVGQTRLAKMREVIEKRNNKQ